MASVRSQARCEGEARLLRSFAMPHPLHHRSHHPVALVSATLRPQSIGYGHMLGLPQVFGCSLVSGISCILSHHVNIVEKHIRITAR
jgi:hypothetical protein